MKNFRFLVLGLLASTLALGFVSCSKEKDDNSGINTEQTPDKSGEEDSKPTEPVSPTFKFSEYYNESEKSIFLGEELTFTIGNLNADTQVSVSLDGKEIELKNGVINLPTSKEGKFKLNVVVNNEVYKFTYNVLSDIEVVTVGDVKFKMIKVVGGTYVMGAPEEQEKNGVFDFDRPAHQVTVSNFYIGQTEVTQALWKAVMKTLPDGMKNIENKYVGDDLPVVYVSWNDMQDFIKELNSQTGKEFRLPTEEEWEFAARGGNKSQGYIYSGSNDIDEVAWYTDNSAVYGEKVAHAVGTKNPNELGIYDMTGNVWELCQNLWYAYDGSSKDESSAVYRGGNFSSSKQAQTVSFRYMYKLDEKGNHVGFRLAL